MKNQTGRHGNTGACPYGRGNGKRPGGIPELKFFTVYVSIIERMRCI